ncbi:MAG: TonB family protein [Bacteroidales bacterium]|nr:TonB family protein [Bacteroidales bacterium]
MEKKKIIIKLQGLKLYYKWYSFLFFITKNKHYFDKKIRIGIMILSLMTTLTACQQRENTVKSPVTEPKKELKKDTVVNKNDTSNNTKSNPNKGKNIKFTPSDFDNESCYDKVSCYIVISDYEATDPNKPYLIVEQMPEFPGGEEKLLKYLQNNIVYPQTAKENNITGKVFVTFVISRDGAVKDVKVLKGIGGGCDEEAVRVIKNMPKWQPGKQDGKSVDVRFNLPIKFALQAN